MELTQRQEAILNFVTQHRIRAGYPPTLREIARHFGIKGISAVKKHLDVLEEKGCLARRRGARTIDLPDLPRMVSVPVLGQVAAGRPILAQEHVLGTLALDRSVVRFSRPFLLRVRGDSMVEAGILDGDHVLVKAQPHAAHGEIVVALIDDEATVKRFLRRGEQIVLQPENTRQQPIVLTARDQVRILGKVMGVVRFPALRDVTYKEEFR